MCADFANSWVLCSLRLCKRCLFTYTQEGLLCISNFLCGKMHFAFEPGNSRRLPGVLAGNWQPDLLPSLFFFEDKRLTRVLQIEGAVDGIDDLGNVFASCAYNGILFTFRGGNAYCVAFL